MAESIVVTRQKNRARTAKWRERQKQKPSSEARLVDKAIASALVHMLVREKATVDGSTMPRLLTLAVKILARRHDKALSTAAVAKRVKQLWKANELGIVERYEALDRAAERDRQWAERHAVSA